MTDIQPTKEQEAWAWAIVDASTILLSRSEQTALVYLIARRLAEREAGRRGDAKMLRRLSDALLKVRPLGGSELFTKYGDDFVADPNYCGKLIDEMSAELHKARSKAHTACRIASRALDRDGLARTAHGVDEKQRGINRWEAYSDDSHTRTEARRYADAIIAYLTDQAKEGG